MTLFLDPSKTNLSPTDQGIVDDLYAHVRALETVTGEGKDKDWLDAALTDARNAISLEAHAILASWQSTLGQATHVQGVDTGVVQAAVDAILTRLGISLPPTSPVQAGPINAIDLDQPPAGPGVPSSDPAPVGTFSASDNPDHPFTPPSTFVEPSRSGGI